MKNTSKRFLSMLICLAMLAGFVLVGTPVQTQARNYGVYEDVANVYDQGSCPSMQGMSVHGSYVYACKINGDTEASAVVARVNKDTGSTSYLTNASTGTIYFSDFGHGNDIEVETLGGVTTLFVPTSKTGSGSLVRYKISGTTATKVGSYNMVSTSGSSIGGGAIRVIHYDSDSVTFLFKSGATCYTGTLPLSQTSGNLVMTSLCKLDYSSCYVNGTYKDTSSYSLQGMGYHDFKLYLPLSGHTVSGHENISIILVYDLEGASGTIKPDPDLTFQITSSYYGALFEVESCEISPLDNRMYFSTNRRITSSDTNHDGVSYISNWTYDPTSRTTEVNNYRWETRNDQLVSVTDGGNTYNGVHQLQGTISGGTYDNSRFVLSRNVVLAHGNPWIVEWKSSGDWNGSLLMATQAQSSITGQPFLFRDKSGNQISIGSYSGSQYNNYGVCLSDHGIDGTAEHTYRLTNKILSDGSNMVYLSVDGKELGPMTTYFINGSKQSTTGTWVAGQDFKFSYLGTINHNISGCNLEYLQVWGAGLADISDEPNIYRWESGMTSVTTFGLTENKATLVSGTTSGNTYTDCRYDLSRDIKLMHDRPWVLEWDNSGAWDGTLMLAADHMSNSPYAPYLFRNSSIISIGHHTGSRHEQWGVKLSDHGIDINDPHIYALRNKINADGSNMVYLYVDGEEIAPLTTFCTNGNATSTTSNYLAGKDFVFSYVGTYQHDFTGPCNYIQVWEAGKPEEDEANNYRWETQNDVLTSMVNDTFEKNDAFFIKGTCTNGVYSDAQLMLEKPIVLLHDRHWRVEWQCEGAWSGGGLFLSADYSSYTKNNIYLFRNAGSISMGQYTGSRHEQWGVCSSDYGIDLDSLHTYTLVNKINADGSNMIYLHVDGEEIGPMTSVCINGTRNGETSDYLNGKDFTFSYLGTKEHSVNDTTMTYLQIFEGCEHSYSNSKTVSPTCTEDGYRTLTCSICGDTKTTILPAAGHDYSMTSTPGNCETYTVYHFTCADCGDAYDLDAGTMSTDWIDYLPTGMDENLFNTKTQYRYSDYETVTSYETSLEGYAQKSGAWVQSSTGSVSYVNSWPSGFSTSNSLYSQYNKKSSKVTASESTTAKTVVNSDSVVGYLYYHWCYSGSYYSAATSSGSYTTFHAYYSTTAPSSYTCDTSDMSYKTAHSTCSNSEWFFVADVYKQSYTKYQKQFTYERWTDFSDWADTAVTATDTRKVETRTAYQLKEAATGSHSYNAKVTAPTCTAEGYTTYTCSICGHSYKGNTTAIISHSYSAKITTAATCEKPGIKTYTCSGCGDSYTETVAATGHSYTARVTTAPTCTKAGVRTYTCSCGASYTEGVAALGHSYSGGYCSICGIVDPAYDTNVDYYLFGYINGADYACEADYENMGIYKFVDGKLTATFTEDSYVAVKTEGNGCWFMTDGWEGNAVTSVTLYDTNTLFAADKLFVPGGVELTFTLVNNGDGTLTLSYEQASAVVTPTIGLKYPSLSFEDVIIMNVYYTATDLDSVVEMGMITYSEKVTSYSIETAEAVIPGYYWSEGDGFYYSTTEGIAAKCLGDTIYFAIYAKLSDGSYTYTSLIGYSPKTYAYNQLKTGSAEMKPLVAAMLNYGAAAQTYFSYHTDSLVNAAMTAEQQALVKDYSATMMNGIVTVDSNKVGVFTNTNGFTRKYPTISFEGAFSINYYFVPSETPSGNVAMYYWNQAAYNAATTLTAANASGRIIMTLNENGEYQAVVEDIAAKDLDGTIYVAAGYTTASGSQCSGVLAYSIGAYCVSQAAKATTLQPFAAATAVYGYYAKQLFG